MSQLQVNLDLVRKYNVAAPRYTSYPPATQFTEEVQWAQIADELIANNRAERDLSLYFHIPFCQSLCWYCGCNTVITRDTSRAPVYLDYLERQMDQMGAVLNPERSVVQLHFGGGTPTFLSPEQLRRLGQEIRTRFKIDEELEAGVEIDPRGLTEEHVHALREAGFNRASIGVQDFDPVVQTAIHRRQPLVVTREAIRWIREARFESVNFDLIYGLPYQTAESFERTLEEVLLLEPDRIALFSYAHVPWLKRSQRALEKRLPPPEVKMRILKMAVEKLTADDRYTYIGMDHFARPADSLAVAQSLGQLHRNFQGYSTHGEADIFAFGISGISQTENAYWQNEKELKAYYAALDAGRAPVTKGYLVTDEDRIRREAIMRIMCDLALNLRALSQKFGINAWDHFSRELESLAECERDGLIRWTTFGFEVTGAGRLLLRSIAMAFDAYYRAATEKRFSRTI